ncbi:TetR family transcriptional regulator C-terminal domain-containing protein [Penaeicola halotolerans]|uniref:TetR family transcriptional regulator C-terminal domain-containing protein n=1 Tax=Penaeicola halotolerans TaxID=2793196 RepID=UPI001CF86FE7|nr:TetR family transcriptional regulator C-terminal domain-containing protein [Penaeicola halotolerans]
MEKTTAKTAKEKKSPEAQIKEAYITYLLEHGQAPASVFKFAKLLKMKEEDFYNYYNSFEGVESAIWTDIFGETKSRLDQDKTYIQYSVREKLLAFYFTWLEVLKSNRSYIQYSLQQIKEKKSLDPTVLKGFKSAFKQYAEELMSEGKETDEVVARPVISDRYADLLWMQAMFLLNFWQKDTSKGFERTDAAVEKAVNLFFDLIGKSALDSMLDFAKFIYQNK